MCAITGRWNEEDLTPTFRRLSGDLHAGNVLLLDDRTPRFIDFALAGSGHPCFDLVRVSSAIAYTSIRAVHPEPELRRFFRQIHIDHIDIDGAKQQFAGLLAGASAQLAAQALISARDVALETLAENGHDEADYRAMVYLVTVQSLTMDEFQSAIVRPALGAIHPRVKALAEAG